LIHDSGRQREDAEMIEVTIGTAQAQVLNVGTLRMIELLFLNLFTGARNRRNTCSSSENYPSLGSVASHLGREPSHVNIGSQGRQW